MHGADYNKYYGERDCFGTIDSIEKFDQMLLILLHAVADPGFAKGSFMRMCTVATTPPYDVHAHRCNESGCCS